MAKVVLRSRIRRKKLMPKAKVDKKSWQTRNEARKPKQEAYATSRLPQVELEVGDGTPSEEV